MSIVPMGYSDGNNRCEYCGNPLPEYPYDGRFCCKGCAMQFNKLEEERKRVHKAEDEAYKKSKLTIGTRIYTGSMVSILLGCLNLFLLDCCFPEEFAKYTIFESSDPSTIQWIVSGLLYLIPFVLGFRFAKFFARIGRFLNRRD